MTVAERPMDVEEPLELEIDRALEQALQKHAGQWVAMTRTELLAFGDDPQKVYEEAQAKGAESPIVYRVPDQVSETYYY